MYRTNGDLAGVGLVGVLAGEADLRVPPVRDVISVNDPLTSGPHPSVNYLVVKTNKNC